MKASLARTPDPPTHDEAEKEYSEDKAVELRRKTAPRVLGDEAEIAIRSDERRKRKAEGKKPKRMRNQTRPLARIACHRARCALSGGGVAGRSGRHPGRRG